MPVTRYLGQGSQIPPLGQPARRLAAETVNSPHREAGAAGSASGLGQRTESNPGTAPQVGSTIGQRPVGKYVAKSSAEGVADEPSAQVRRCLVS